MVEVGLVDFEYVYYDFVCYVYFFVYYVFVCV